MSSSSDLLRFNGRSSSGRDLKSVYLIRGTLQEVEMLPTLSLFPPKGAVWSDFF